MIETRENVGCIEGKAVNFYTITNRNGIRMELTNYGAILSGLCTPDRNGKFADITLGHGTLDGWIGDKAYLGATVGRYGNRIAEAHFSLDGKTYSLAANNGANHLHGGIRGFNVVVWDAKPFQECDREGVEFTYVSADGEEGYPGELTTRARYALTGDNKLIVEFGAVTTKPTVVNIVQHVYWNLSGDPRKSILNHELTLCADKYLPVDEAAIPTGGPVSVKGSPMDFTLPVPIGSRIGQVKGGYDHCWVLSDHSGELRPAATLYDPDSGRFMELMTDQPGIQFYAGNFLDGSIVGRGGIAYQRNTGLCLETELWPDSPNRPSYPSSVLRPGQTYRHVMAFSFQNR